MHHFPLPPSQQTAASGRPFSFGATMPHMERSTGSRPSPRRRSKPIRLVQLTDTHLAVAPLARMGDTRASLARCLEHARERHFPVDAVLLTGDLVHDERDAYRLLAAAFDGVGVPVHALGGNHDENAALEPVLRKRPFRAASATRYGAWAVVLVDTAVAGATHGEVSGEALTLLDEHLRRHADAHVLLAMHHQPVPVGSRWIDALGIVNAAALWAVIARHDNVRGIVWGHVHQAFDAMHDGVMLMATPSTCVQFAPGRDSFALDDRPPGYRWLHLYPDGRIDTRVEWVEEPA